MYGLNEIREKFLKFFENKGHLRLKSASLVPHNDKSLLLISAGMAPLKPYFTGQKTPPSKRVVSCQKCLRTNDIENVGVTSRHCTFFEMLGNFSFGDYFKEEIIPWAWEFLTEEVKISPDKLFPSVYVEDDEAFNIWHNKVGLPEEKITRLGKEDNFWEIGVGGPCGPCSEIYFDRGAENGCSKPDCKPGCDCDRFIEIWNLVFTQFTKEEDGSYSKLKNTNIDTGMGLERMSLVLQNVSNIFDIDTFKILRDRVCKISGISYGSNTQNDMSIRIITDHMRAVVFMLSDGILPSNEGRGYILRRLLRRAARHGRLLGINDAFLTKIAETVIAVSEGAYPELREKFDYILKLVDIEERRFYETLNQGMDVLKKVINTHKESLTPEFLGSQAFLLYDTYGFPVELTIEILRDEGIKTDINMDVFNKEMEEQRNRARSAREETNYMGADVSYSAYSHLPEDITTEFLGYELDSVEAKILALVSDNKIVDKVYKDSEISVFTDKTVFYAEGGGQKGDCGVIKTSTGTVQITDCQKVTGERLAHIGKVSDGFIENTQTALLSYNKKNRQSTARNHTATHLLHKALKDVLGGHVEQSGSLVSKDRLRFDFTHFSAMTQEEIEKVETLVNSKILEGIAVESFWTDISKAREMGATALFGEKYGDSVRVIKIGDYSMELCGGTHLSNTAQTGMFKILSENGIAAGVRRIEALTGGNTAAYYHNIENSLREAAALLKSTPDNLIGKIKTLIADKNEFSKEVERLKSRSSVNLIDALCTKKEVINGINVIADCLENLDANSQRDLSDKIKQKIGSVLIILYVKHEDKNTLLVSATEDVVKTGVHCGNIVKETAKAFSGNGGGRPNMASAGIPGDNNPQSVIDKAKSCLI